MEIEWSGSYLRCVNCVSAGGFRHQAAFLMGATYVRKHLIDRANDAFSIAGCKMEIDA